MEAILRTDEELPAMVDVWLALITMKTIRGAESYGCKLHLALGVALLC
jgi:hypothetical protein